MKLALKTLVIAFAAATAVPAAFADTASDGTVHITGTIKQNACTVENNSVNVVLKDEFASVFTAAGQTSGDKEFTIDLKDCDSQIYSRVQTRFEGTLDGSDPTILKNVVGTAGGVGVQILDNGTAMAINNESAWSSEFTISGTTAKIPFTARYISTATAVTAGSVDTTATFYLQYN